MLTKAKKSIVLLQGNPGEKLFDLLKKRGAKEVFVLEGRPNLKGERFKKIFKRKITPTLISDNMAGFLFYKGLVKEIWIGYQSLKENGALCNIGALILGVLGKKHKVTVNLFPSNGSKTEVSAKPDAIFYFEGKRIAPKGIKGYVPLVEWLPKKYITKVY